MRFYQKHEKAIKKIINITVFSRSLRHQICATLASDMGLIQRLKTAHSMMCSDKVAAGGGYCKPRCVRDYEERGTLFTRMD